MHPPQSYAGSDRDIGRVHARQEPQLNCRGPHFPDERLYDRRANRDNILLGWRPPEGWILDHHRGQVQARQEGQEPRSCCLVGQRPAKCIKQVQRL